VGLLRDLGYTHVRHYRGGLAGWRDAGNRVESRDGAPEPIVEPTPALGPHARRPPAAVRRPWGAVLLDLIERQSPARLFALWLSVILLSAGVYWLAGLSEHHGLRADGRRVETSLAGFATAVYFSFVTATSIGYGDVVPVGGVRALAIAEAVSGLLVFGALVAKFVSRRQDELVREIHRVTFEERLDRVQTNLHLVLSELQAIAAMCGDESVHLERVRARLESAALVFASELRAIHGLLYRPQWAAEETVLGAILASLAGSFGALADALACLPPSLARTPTLDGALRSSARLAREICGECVPRAYAPALTVWMDRISEMASRIG
jgi:hypothetical protein